MRPLSTWLQGSELLLVTPKEGQMEALWGEPLQSVNSSGRAGAQPSGPSASQPAKALAHREHGLEFFSNLRSGGSARRRSGLTEAPHGHFL